MNPKVTIIIINWNGWQDTVECLESLYQIKYHNYDIILVDNNSENNSINKIKEYCKGEIEIESQFFKYNLNNKPVEIFEYLNGKLSNLNSNDKISTLDSNKKLILIKNDKNYGFAEGSNIGIRFALNNLDSDYILLLNNDTVVDKHFLEELLSLAESDKNIGFVGSKTYYYNKKNVIQLIGGGKLDFKRGIPFKIDLDEIDNAQYDRYIEVDYIGGSCLLCKRNVIDQIGTLDPTYFMYWEDIDWCIRGHKAGYKSIYAFKSKIWHKIGVSSVSYHKIYYHYRNRIYFMKKNADRNQYTKFLLKLFVFMFWQESTYFLDIKDFKKYISYCKGLFNGFKLNY